MSVDGVQHILAMQDDTPFVEYETNLIKDAIKVRLEIESSDCSLFFKRLRSPSLNYFFACLMIIFLKPKYLHAIETIYKRFA